MENNNRLQKERETNTCLYRRPGDSRTGSVSGAEPTAAAEAFDAVHAAAQEEAELARVAALAAATGGGSRKDKDHNLKQIMQERFDLYKVTGIFK